MPWTTKRNKTEKSKRFFQFMKENSMVTLKKITYVAFYIANMGPQCLNLLNPHYLFSLVLQTEPHHIFTIPVKSDNYDEDEENGLFAVIKISYTPEYPEQLPILELEDCVNIDEYNLRNELLEHLTQQVSR